MSVEHEFPPEERLFQAALAHDVDEREAFIKKATEGDVELFEAVQALLLGYEESGGDEGDLTLGPGRSARQEWAEVAQESPGMRIGNFRLVRMIGEGGMGTVWEAEQTTPVSRHVALKVVKLGMDTVEVIERFKRERQTLASMNHPNIAQVLEAGATALGRPYFVMELVDGVPITEYAETATLDLRQRLVLFLKVCQGIEHAHQKGVIHRDLKPSNILVAQGDVKIIDFGVAKATRESSEQTLFTKHSQVLGTPAYMSPEQALSDGLDVDTRTDVYSLGVVLYQLLSGQLPIDPDRLTSTGMMEMQKILTEEEPPCPSAHVTAVQGALPKDLDWVVMKALAKERERRYPSAASLTEELQRFLNGEMVQAAPPTLSYRFGKFVRKNKIVVTAMAAIILALATGLVTSLIQVKRAHAAEQAATFTVADLYTRNGLGEDDPATAALWFAKAAVTARGDSGRVLANGHRVAAWQQTVRVPVRAFLTELPYASTLRWHPLGEALVADYESGGAEVWQIDEERLWDPLKEESLSFAAWSPSGEMLAIVEDERVAVYAYPQGEVLAAAPTDHASMITWHPDGEELAVAGHGGFCWRWRSGETISLAQDERPLTLSYSEDGDLLLVVVEQEVSVSRRENDFQELAFDPLPCDGTYLPAWLGEDSSRFYLTLPNGDLEIRDVDGQLVHRQPGWVGLASGPYLAVSPDGRFIAQGSGGALDLATGKEAPFPQNTAFCRARAFRADGQMLAMGDYDQRLNLWSVPDGEWLGRVGRPNSAVIDVAFSADGQWLAASENGLVKVFRVPVETDVSWRLPLETTSLAKLSSNGRWIFPSGHSELSSRVTATQAVDVATGDLLGDRIQVGGILTDSAWGRDDVWIALAVSTTPNRSSKPFTQSSGDGGSGFVRLVDPESGEWQSKAFVMPSEPRGVCVHPDGNLIGVCCASGEGVEIDLSKGESRTLFDHDAISRPHEWANNGRCRYTPDGRILIVWGLYEYLHLWDREAQRRVIEPYYPESHFPDVDVKGEVISAIRVHQDNFLKFYQDDGEPARAAIPYPSNPWLGRFDPSGTRFLTGGTGKVAEVWDWRAGKRLGPVLPHAGTVAAGSFLSQGDEPWCATGGFEGSVRFWDYATGMALRPPVTMADSWILDMTTTPDGRHLIVCSVNGIDVIDMERALPQVELAAEDALLLAEINASAEIHPSGGLVPLTDSEWLKRWQAFRKRMPNYSGHSYSLRTVE